MNDFDPDGLRKRIEDIKSRTGKGVRLLAATKTVCPEAINFALNCGIDLIGENRVQELTEKYDAIDKTKTEIHFIGRLQKNKVKYIIDKVSMIESLDSLPLAEEIEKRAAAKDIVMNCLVELNYGEESKGGVPFDEAGDFLDLLTQFPHINVRGIMAIPPKYENVVKKRCCFEKIYKKFIDIGAKKADNISMEILSMGMSGDFETAIECGATEVRIGSAIFGKRV